MVSLGETLAKVDLEGGLLVRALERLENRLAAMAGDG